MTNTAIMANELVKTFKNGKEIVRGVDGLTLAVGEGETYGLIGPDGAGKTTSLRVILGLLTRTAGESAILGFDSMRDSYAIRECTGYIAQQNVLPPDLTVMESMRFFAGVHNMDRAAQKRRIPELLDFTGLAGFTTRLTRQLSGGMKKKLALACSLIHEPRIVVLDEPTLGVDPVSRREFWSLLGDLQAEKGLTILVSTPYMDEAERCTQIGLIYAGRLIATGAPAAIKTALPGHLLELAPADLPAARRAVGGLEGVLEVQTYGDRLHVFVDDVERRGPEVVAALNATGIAHDSPREIEVRMEEAFISLIRKQEAIPLEGALK